MTTAQNKKTATPVTIRFMSFVLDRLLPPLRWSLIPFWIATRFLGAFYQIVCLMSNEYLKRKFGSCGQGVRIYGRFRVTAPHHLYIGDNVHINDNAFIRAEGGLKIGDHTHISRNLVVYTMNHQYQGSRLPYDEQKVYKPVDIGKNVWIGMNVSIVPGITIGDGAIIGMGTVVSQDVPPLAIVGNPPQRILKHRIRDHYEALNRSGAHSGVSGYEWNDQP